MSLQLGPSTKVDTLGRTKVLDRQIVRVSKEITRVADTNDYAVGDVISNNVTTTTMNPITGCALVSGGSGRIVRARLTTNKKSITPKIRVHLYNALAATLAGDNVAYEDKYADEAKIMTVFDFPAMVTAADSTNSDTSYAELEGTSLNIPYVCATGSTTIYVVLEAQDIFTPASAQKFTLTLWLELN